MKLISPELIFSCKVITLLSYVSLYTNFAFCIWEMIREYLRRADEKLKRFEDAGEDVQSAMRKAMEETNKAEMEQNALLQGWSKQNPGKTRFEMGGPETQKLYDEILANPSVKTNRSEAFTCDYCKFWSWRI